jgi:mutator protein MutT
MHPTRIAIAVVEQESCILIGQRPPGIPLAGLWEFPGGKIEPGESPQEAAVRECREEAGIEVQVTGCYLVHEEEYPHGRVELHFLSCRPAQENRSPLEAPFRWVPRQQLGEYEFPSGNRKILAILTGDFLT